MTPRPGWRHGPAAPARAAPRGRRGRRGRRAAAAGRWPGQWTCSSARTAAARRARRPRRWPGGGRWSGTTAERRRPGRARASSTCWARPGPTGGACRRYSAAGVDLGRVAVVRAPGGFGHAVAAGGRRTRRRGHPPRSPSRARPRRGGCGRGRGADAPARGGTVGVSHAGRPGAGRAAPDAGPRVGLVCAASRSPPGSSAPPWGVGRPGPVVARPAPCRRCPCRLTPTTPRPRRWPPGWSPSGRSRRPPARIPTPSGARPARFAPHPPRPVRHRRRGQAGGPVPGHRPLARRGEGSAASSLADPGAP